MAANENALTLPIFELGICSLNKNGVEFDQDCNGNQLRGLCWHFYVPLSYRKTLTLIGYHGELLWMPG